MPTVMGLKSVEDTTLWKRLDEWPASEPGADVAKVLAANLLGMCREASDRMKRFPSLHAEYTLHDETHLLRVTELMALIVGESLDALNPVEIALLILSAHYHDQGMVLEANELADLKEDPDFKIHQSNWEIEHPNLRDVRAQLRLRHLSEEEADRCRAIEQELLGGLLTDFIRTTHGERSATFVRERYGDDPRWVAGARQLAPLVAKLCESHMRSTEDITPGQGFHHDEDVGTYQVNMPYLALALRIADILDFDRERTPDVLYRTIHFTNEVSLEEWMKHRSVQGWTVSPDMIRFTMACDHPIYQRAALEFMDMIDGELAAAHQLYRSFPSSARGCQWDLLVKVDRERIAARNGSYVYHDLEFSLSRDEIIRLFMVDNLYGSPSLCIRELLQNSLDALRHRKAVIKRDNGTDWGAGLVTMEHSLNEHGQEVVTCRDNGIGMDEDIIKRFLTQVGRSYYRSPDFERELVSLRQAGVDFDPCARFGIGFLSCFMLGDQITIRTRRDYGPARGLGDPVTVEISGIGGLLVFRAGDPDQLPGTTVEIVCRERQTIIHEWSDKVALTTVVDGYALACEFPVEASCRVPKIQDELTVPPTIAVRATDLETLGVARQLTLEQDFSEVHHELHGTVRASFLVDDNDRVVIENSEAKWTLTEKQGPQLESPGGRRSGRTSLRDNPVCLDGILVCGKPGRQKDPSRLGVRSNNVVFLGGDSGVLDVRGALKPPLTPSRIPNTDMHRHSPQWDRVGDLASLAWGRLWEELAAREEIVADPELFWQLVLAHEALVPWMRAGAIWEHVSIPVTLEGGEPNWMKLSKLPLLSGVSTDEGPQLVTSAGAAVGRHDQLLPWDPQRQIDARQISQIRTTVAVMSTMKLDGNVPALELKEPDQPEEAPAEHRLPAMPFTGTTLLPYAGQAAGLISLQFPVGSANRDHPLCQLALDTKYTPEHSEIEEFARALVYHLGDPKSMPTLGSRRETVTRGLRYLGHLQRAVDWRRVADDLAPPYKIWLEDEGEVELTGEDFEAWADAEPEE